MGATRDDDLIDTGIIKKGDPKSASDPEDPLAREFQSLIERLGTEVSTAAVIRAIEPMLQLTRGAAAELQQHVRILTAAVQRGQEQQAQGEATAHAIERAAKRIQRDAERATATTPQLEAMMACLIEQLAQKFHSIERRLTQALAKDHEALAAQADARGARQSVMLERLENDLRANSKSVRRAVLAGTMFNALLLLTAGMWWLSTRQ